MGGKKGQAVQIQVKGLQLCYY